VEIFIAGESYAGFYVPWIAEHIVQMQLVTAADGSTSRVKAGKQLSLNFQRIEWNISAWLPFHL
jgi:carboxypeptidase C (cathepsin A)